MEQQFTMDWASDMADLIERQCMARGGIPPFRLEIPVDAETLHKIDEDLFYRTKEEGDEREFSPTKDGAVTLDCGNVIIGYHISDNIQI